MFVRCDDIGSNPLSYQMAVKNCFIRGSVVRYVQLPAEHIDTQLLEDATRRGAFQAPPPQSTRMLTSSEFLEAINQNKR